jgi:hypothetical protein
MGRMGVDGGMVVVMLIVDAVADALLCSSSSQ